MSSLATRLDAARRNLADLALEGPVERDYLPASENMLIRGKRHTCAAPAKRGKSIGWQTHAVDMVAAGATVAILDRENGSDEYARRLRDIMRARGDDPQLWQAVRDRLHYYEFPSLLLADSNQLGDALGGYDLVIFDSSRVFLSAVNLGEDKADDYAKFMAALIDPVARAGTATLILDNTGHEASDRPRGSSAKADLNEVIFTLKANPAPSPTRAGRLQLTCTQSRFGQTGNTWTIRLGGGEFGSWEPTTSNEQADAEWKPTAYMERVSRVVETHAGLSKRAVRESVKGRNEYKDLALELLISEGYIEVHHERGTNQHHSLKPYREPDPETERADQIGHATGTQDGTDRAHETAPETGRAHRAQTVPNRAQGTPEQTVPTVPPSSRRGTGHAHNDTTQPALPVNHYETAA